MNRLVEALVRVLVSAVLGVLTEKKKNALIAEMICKGMVGCNDPTKYAQDIAIDALRRFDKW